MAMLEHFRDRAGWSPRWRIAIIFVSIFCLIASVATRYTTLGPECFNVTVVKSQSTDAKRQNLLSDALQWTAPAPAFTVFQPPRSAIFAVSILVPSTNLISESWLYNRPPPSC
jgi:hypothetical protein